MHILGTLAEPQFTQDGKLKIVLNVKERAKALEEMEKLKDKELVIDIDVFRHKRSMDANAYFWQLIDKMGKALGIDKWTVYLMELSRWGVFVDVTIKPIALDTLKQHFRYTEVLAEDDESVTVRCFYGSSDYDSKEMSDLIQGTVEDAKDLKVETLTPEEIALMIEQMKEREK